MPAEGELFSVSFSVPGAPRGKGRPRTAVRAGRAMIYTDAKTRSEEGAVRMFAQTAMQGQAPYLGAVVLRVCAYCPIPASLSKPRRAAALSGALAPITRPDWDNYGKLASDSLNGIVWHDDSQVVTAVVHKRYSDQPRISIDVRSMATV